MRGQRKKNENTQKQKTCCLFHADRGFAPSPEATFWSLFSPDYSVYWLLHCPQGVVSTTLSHCLSFHISFFHVWPCLSLLLILRIFSWDNQPQCCSLWPREALPPHLTHLLKSPAFQHRDPNPATMTEHSQPVGPVCLTSNQKQPGWVCQHSVCCAWLFIMNGKFCKNCPFSEPWSQLACVLANECFSVFLDLMLLLSLPSVSAKEIVRWMLKWKTTDNDHHILSFFWHFTFWCDVTDWSSWQFVIMSFHLSPSAQAPKCNVPTNWIYFRTRTCCIECCLRQIDNCWLFVEKYCWYCKWSHSSHIAGAKFPKLLT